MTYFAFLLGMGAVVSQLRLARVSPRGERNAWLAAGIGILLAALAGARLVYSLERFAYYSHRPLEVFSFWLGGFAWQGAVLGAWLAIVFLFFAWQKPFDRLLDWTSVMVLPMAVTGWLGAWTEGVAYGEVLPDSTWWGMPAVDVNGNSTLHVPLQLAASLGLFVLIGAVETFFPRFRKPGATGALVWLVFSLAMIPLTLFRADPSPLLLQLRVESWYAILFAGVSLFLFLGLILSPKSTPADAVPVSIDELKDGFI